MHRSLLAMGEWEYYSASNFEAEAAEMLGRASGLHVYHLPERRFKALFGVSSEICAILWEELKVARLTNSKPVHLLWALLFLKNYATEDVNCEIASVDPKTFRKWVWVILKAMSNISLVSLVLAIFQTN